MKKANTSIKKNSGEVKSSYQIDRRDFLKNLGGGIIILFSATKFPFLHGMAMPSEQAQPDLNAYLRIGEDGRVIYKSAPGPAGFLPRELDAAIKKTQGR